MKPFRCIPWHRVPFLLALVIVVPHARAQQVQAEPGRYDYYLLNLSWAPAFCDTLNTLTPVEKQARGGTECAAPHGFVLHGLWPQNFDGSYPGSCDTRPGPADYRQYLDMTPDVSLLQHEWAKHGTCTTLMPEAFFAAARRAYQAVRVPAELQQVTTEQRLPPADILQLFYRANPAFPAGSFNLSCGRNELTAMEACFNRDLQPIACQNIRSCRARTVKVLPPG